MPVMSRRLTLKGFLMTSHKWTSPPNCAVSLWGIQVTGKMNYLGEITGKVRSDRDLRGCISSKRRGGEKVF